MLFRSENPAHPRNRTGDPTAYHGWSNRASLADRMARLPLGEMPVAAAAPETKPAQPMSLDQVRTSAGFAPLGGAASTVPAPVTQQEARKKGLDFSFFNPVGTAHAGDANKYPVEQRPLGEGTVFKINPEFPRGEHPVGRRHVMNRETVYNPELETKIGHEIMWKIDGTFKDDPNNIWYEGTKK